MKITFYKGSWEDIAYQFYLNYSENSSIRYSLTLVKNIFEKNSNIFEKIFLKWFQKTVSIYFYRKLDSNLKKFLKKYSEVSKYKFSDLAVLYCFPDFLTYVFAKAPAIKLPHINLGCSSVVKNLKNSIEHGRNLDYFGGNIWANNHEIVVLNPENAQKSINILSEGFFSAGITSINESMLSFSLHMLYTSEINKNGEPILSILFKLINNATSINDVRDILSKIRSITGWGIIVCNHNDNTLHLFELTGKQYKEIKIEEKNFAYVNMYLSSLKDKEFLFSYIWIQNNFLRFKRLNELLGKNVDTLDILSDRTELLKDTIANTFTISSAIFNGKKDFLAVADNKVPASIGSYKIYSIKNLFNGKIIEKGEVKTKNSDNIRKNRDYILVDAFDNFLLNGDLKEFIKNLEKMEDCYIKNLFLSISFAKLGKFKKALEYLEETFIDTLDKYRKGSLLLLKGIYFDILKDRDSAINIYKEVIEKYNFPDLTFHSINFLKKPCKKKKLKYIDISLFLSHYVLL